MSRRVPILFVDRDGTLIEEPADHQIDRFEKLRFVRGVIPAMLRLREAGYQFVMVTNQDGLGTEAFPQADFDGPHRLMMHVLESQGIAFRDVLIDTSLPADNAPTRKPGIGMVLDYLKDRDIDWSRSAMVGDRETDIGFAANLGIRAFQLRTPEFGGEWDWNGIAHALVDSLKDNGKVPIAAKDNSGFVVNLLLVPYMMDAIRALLGHEGPRDFRLPDIRGLAGAIVLLGFVLYPYVYLTARAMFMTQAAGLLDAARTVRSIAAVNGAATVAVTNASVHSTRWMSG